MSERDVLEKALTNLEEQRAVLGDATVDAAVAGIRLQIASLETNPESQGQRKQVTVLFADVSGFTAMSETMDAEDVREVMNDLWDVVDKTIINHDGHIDKHIGDAVMAIWGSEVATEDDPEQAIRAALAMQAAVQAFANKHDVPLSLHIGLNTGLVFLGEVGTTREFTAMGDTVNTASRLEEAAPLDGILISHDTYRHVRGVFDVQPREPMVAKGKSEPLQVYLVKQAKPRAFRMGTRGIEGIETKTVGRDQELGELFAAYEGAFRENRTTVVTMVGEAGVGKSRLLFEFEQWLDLRPELIRFFKGRASQRSKSIPQLLLRDVLAARFQILDSDPLEVLQEKFVTGLDEFMPDDVEMKASILGTWLGYDFTNSPYIQPIEGDPKQIKNRATLYLTQLVAAITQQAPTVILLEDIHWADGGSLDALIDLSYRAPGLPLLMVALARPSLYERRPDWGEKMPVHTRLNIAPLTEARSRALVEELLQMVDPLPEALVQLIVSRAAGNPFFAEELVKMLIDDGAIIKQAEGWKVSPQQFKESKVPATLVGVLQARLDRLQPEEKRAIQKASVIGRVFWDEALAVLSQAASEVLPSLQKKEIIYQRANSAFAGTKEYIFKHTILWDVTYNTVLKRYVRGYHELVANWLVTAADGNGRLDEYAPLIAEHYGRAEHQHPAAAWYSRAGEKAASIFAYEEAVQYFTLALDFIEENDYVTQFNLLKNREKANDIRADRRGQKKDLDQLESLASRLDTEDQARISLRLAHFADATSDHESARAHAQAAMALAHSVGDWSTYAWSQIALGELYRKQGLFEDALLCFQQAEEELDTIGDQDGLAQVLHYKGNVATHQADLEKAHNFYVQSLALRRQLGNQDGIAHSLNNLAIIAEYRGQFEESLALQQQALVLRRELGDRRMIAVSLNNLGDVLLLQGHYEAARANIEEAISLYREIGDRWLLAQSLSNLGSVARETGEMDEAHKMYAESLAIFLEVDDPWSKANVLDDVAHLVHLEGDAQTAVRIIRAAKALRSSIAAPLPPREQADHNAFMDRLQRDLGDEVFGLMEAEEVLPINEALRLALRLLSDSS